MSVHACQQAVSSAEFAAWMAYDRLYPLNTGDQLLAQLLSLTANVHRDPKKRAYHPLDFLPDPFEQRTTPEQERKAIADVKRKLRENYAARMEGTN